MQLHLNGFVTALAVVASLGVSAARADNKVIYGNDDRLDLYQVTDTLSLRLADSTLALFRSSNVAVNATVANLTLTPFAQEMDLCTTEPFYNQSTGAFCSGSLVGPDLIMTAGHCVTSQDDCNGTKFVFGFAVKQANVLPTSVAATEVYGCAKLITRMQEGTGADYALVQLDRKVVGHAPLRISRTGVITNGTKLIMIGHPTGLPVKVAGGNTVVRDASPNGFFTANTDSYGGNSGSAVFNANTGLIEGILVRGERDFTYTPQGCSVSYVCTDEGCRGEDVTKISALAQFVPKLPGE